MNRFQDGEHEAAGHAGPGGSTGIGERGEAVPGPPWILGHRGTPREAPENTLVSLRRALEYGLDGFEYDVRATGSGEAVLIHDATLDRTTNARGLVVERTLPELFGVDAGGGFHTRFEGEPLPLLPEALDLGGERPDSRPMHMIELKERGLVPEVARQLAERGRGLSVRIASFMREPVLEARDLGLPSMLLADRATEDDRRFVRDERIAAHGVGPGGWDNAAGQRTWSCERWSWSVDDPEQLLVDCRAPLFGFNTNEPARALAIRALVHLTPEDDGPYPIQVPELEVTPDPGTDGAGEVPVAAGEWTGRWSFPVAVRNPFAFEVRVEVFLAPRGGAWEFEGLPVAARLAPGEEFVTPLALHGGSRSPGSDPVVLARYRWAEGPGRPLGVLVLDAPLTRTRRVRCSAETQRLPLLREGRVELGAAGGPSAASVTLRRRGEALLFEVEHAAGLVDPHLIVRLGSGLYRGGLGLRLWLPEDFDRRSHGIEFSVGIEGKGAGGELQLLRWAGGVPEGLEAGRPGRLLPR